MYRTYIYECIGAGSENWTKWKDKWNRMYISQANIPKSSICDTMWLLTAFTTHTHTDMHIHILHTHTPHTPHICMQQLCDCVSVCVYFCARKCFVDVLRISRHSGISRARRSLRFYEFITLQPFFRLQLSHPLTLHRNACLLLPPFASFPNIFLSFTFPLSSNSFLNTLFSALYNI